MFNFIHASGPTAPPSHQHVPPAAGKGGGATTRTCKMIELYTTKECPRCVKVRAFFNDNNITFIERVIDGDCEAETDALMLNIFAVPTVKIGTWLLKPKAIFDGKGLMTETFKTVVHEHTRHA